MVGATAYKKRQAPRMGRFADSKVQADAEELPKVKRLRTTEEGFGAKSPMAHSPAAPSTPLQTPAKPISRTPAVPQSEAQKAILDVLEDMAPPTTSLTMSSPAPAQNPYSKSMARDTASLGEGSATPLRSLFAKKIIVWEENCRRERLFFWITSCPGLWKQTDGYFTGRIWDSSEKAKRANRGRAQECTEMGRWVFIENC
ncbi:hypothetical protein BJ742DRAFT_332520 [Cladochytrium replicatum]|nr:hypothetical protein BJ742DRAFT_332520 [Cladochytrium replicatum]